MTGWEKIIIKVA